MCSLARYVGTQAWKLSSVASNKVMSELAAPVIVVLARPVREYWTDANQTTQTNNSMSDASPPAALVPVKEE